MRRFFLFLLLVIILVCLNWFRDAAALELNTLSELDKTELMTRYLGSSAKVNTSTYQTPPIYDSTPSAQVPVVVEDSTETGSVERPERGLTGFDDLEPFGTELFAGPREINPPDDIAASSDYRLGPGDNVIVSLWGQTEKEYVLTVSREGKLVIPKLGAVAAWGKTLGEFEQELRRRFAKIYSQFDLSLSLGEIRSIRVYLTGEVRRPGAYTVSSLTSLFNALYLAGGPNENGSMRDIKLMRGGQTAAIVDLYKFLLEGDNSSDIRLESGDAIFVPVAGARVAIRGKVRREGIYELAPGQTAFDLLKLAGNAQPDAYLERVMLERIHGRDEWEVLDLNLESQQQDRAAPMAMLDGDRVTVFSVFEMKRNMVAVFGMVRHPGYFERNDSTRISDLLERAKLQPYDVYYQRANLFRRHADWRTEVIAIDLQALNEGPHNEDLLLQDGDSLHVYSIADVSWNQYVYIEGEVKQPGRYPLYENMTVEDLVFLAGSFRQGAWRLGAEIARHDSVGTVQLLRVGLNDRVGRATLLAEEDRVYIRQIPQWQLHRTVLIEGEVTYPGEYVLADRDETLYELIKRAGGLTDLAFPEGTILERRSIGETLERLRVPSLLEKSSPLVQDSLGNISRTVLVEYEPQSMNRIVLNVEELLASEGATDNVVLSPGDRVFVPSRPSGISVLGAVGANGTIQFKERERVKYYVRRAGNFTSEADKGAVRLIKANGEVVSGHGTLNHRVDVGDVVVVPTKIRHDHHWGNTLTTVLTTTTGVLTSILLINKL